MLETFHVLVDARNVSYRGTKFNYACPMTTSSTQSGSERKAQDRKESQRREEFSGLSKFWKCWISNISDISNLRKMSRIFKLVFLLVSIGFSNFQIFDYWISQLRYVHETRVEKSHHEPAMCFSRFYEPWRLLYPLCREYATVKNWKDPTVKIWNFAIQKFRIFESRKTVGSSNLFSTSFHWI